jgi:phage baseplate assembly protein V
LVTAFDMSAELSDLQSRIANLIRVGTIHSIVAGRARVSFGENNITAPLPWQTTQAGDIKEWNGHPKVGEQVSVINPGGTGNAGYIQRGAIFTEANPANGTAANTREIDIPSGGKWRVTCGDCAVTFEDGKAKVVVGSAVLELSGSKIKITGDVEVTGKITSTGLIKGGNVTLQTHVHGGVQSGGSNTGQPV